MATSKGVIQGYAAQAAVDSAHHKAGGQVLHDKTASQPIKLFRPGDFIFNDDRTATCPAGKTLLGNGRTYGQRGHRFERYGARAVDCASYHLRGKCLRNPRATRGRQGGALRVAAT